MNFIQTLHTPQPQREREKIKREEKRAEHSFIHHLMLQSPFIKDIGLLHGKTGIALFFYHYAKYTDNIVYSDYADDLLDNIWENLHNRLPDTFASGLTGIAWGIEYMIQNGFVAGNSNDICEDIDARIMLLDPRRMSPGFIKKELGGFLHYILIRITGSWRQQQVLPFDDLYRNDLTQVLSRLQEQEQTNEPCSVLINQYLVFMSSNRSLNYTPNLSLFIDKQQEINKQNIVSLPLGLKDGLAGYLYKQIIDQQE